MEENNFIQDVQSIVDNPDEAIRNVNNLITNNATSDEEPEAESTQDTTTTQEDNAGTVENIQTDASTVVEDERSVLDRRLKALEISKEKERRETLARRLAILKDSDNLEKHSTNIIALTGEEPTSDEVTGIEEVLKGARYYVNEARNGVPNGVIKGVASLVEFVGEVTDLESLNSIGEQLESGADVLFPTQGTVGKIGETVGRIAIGTVSTGGLATTFIARAGQAGVIDGIFFEGDENNVADLAKDLGIESPIVELLRTREADSELAKRTKNAITGLGIGAGIDTIVNFFSLGRRALTKSGVDIDNLTDDELIKESVKAVKKEAIEVDKYSAKSIEDTVPDAKIVDKKLESNVEDSADTLKSNFETVSFQRGDDFLKNADDFIKGVDLDVNLQSPLNSNKLAEGSKEFAELTKNLEFEGSATHVETIRAIDESIRKELGKDSYDFMTDMMKTANNMEKSIVDVGRSRVIVATLYKNYDDSLKVARQSPNASNVLVLINSMDKMERASNILKQSQGFAGQLLNSFNIMPNWMTKDAQLSLKIQDALDPEHSILRLKRAMKSDGAEELQKVIDDLNDVSLGVKEHMEKYRDGTWTKIMNSASEVGIAGMISSPSTMAVNVIGNYLVKHQRSAEYISQYVWGNVLRTKDRMKFSELKMQLSLRHNSTFSHSNIVGKNMYLWGKSGIKDEVMEKSMLVPFSLERTKGKFENHKYVSSTYWRGDEVGSELSALNTTINMFGRAFRSPYHTVGFIDDVFKRSAFRSTLITRGHSVAELRNVKNKDLNGFVEGFIRANTELQLMTNQGKKPNKAWLLKNKSFIGTGTGVSRYLDEAVVNAKAQTFQTELGKGLVGKTVDVLNSHPILRLAVPFKMTPINILKHSLSTATLKLNKKLLSDIANGGVKRDIALSRLTVAGTITYFAYSLATSGRVVGNFKDHAERKVNNSAGIYEQTVLIGDKAVEYKQLEPFATILAVSADLNTLYKRLNMRIVNAEKRNELDEEYTAILADLGMILVNNIANKTYTKSLGELVSVFSGENDLLDYSGKLLSSAIPLSSLSNYIGRVTNEGYKKEAKSFMEKVKSKYRILLDRDALDMYGRPIDDTDYIFGFTVKEYDTNKYEDRGTREVARLGLTFGKMPENISIGDGAMQVSTKLTDEEYHDMRRSLDTTFDLVGTINKVVDSADFLDEGTTDSMRAIVLKNVIRDIRSSAVSLMKTKVIDRLSTKLDVKEEEFMAPPKVSTIEKVLPRLEKSTYNDLIIDKVK